MLSSSLHCCEGHCLLAMLACPMPSPCQIPLDDDVAILCDLTIFSRHEPWHASQGKGH